MNDIHTITDVHIVKNCVSLSFTEQAESSYIHYLVSAEHPGKLCYRVKTTHLILLTHLNAHKMAEKNI